MSEKKKKVVVVGDGNCGKTCMLQVYKNQPFPEEYIPTVFEDYVVSVDLGNRTEEIELIDTAGQAEYDRLRPLSYYNTDAFVLTFSVGDPDTLENITSNRQHFKPRAPSTTINIAFWV